MLILAGIRRFSVAFAREEVVLRSERAEFVLNEPVGLIGETVYRIGKGIEAFA
jgi:hypothetical protein